MASALFKASRLEGLLWALLLVTSTAAGPIVTRAEVVSADQIPANLVIASNQPLAHLAPPQCSPVCGASMVCVHSFTFGPICAADKSLNATAPGVATSLSVHSQDLQPRNPAVFVAEYFASMALDMAFGSIVGSGTDVSAQFEAIAEKMIVQIDGIVKAALTAAWEDRDKKCAKSLLVGIAEYRRTFLNFTDSDGIARTLTVVYDLMATAECNANLMLENLSDPSYSPHATPFWILMAAAKLGLWQERIYLQTLYVPLCSIPQCAKDLADFKKLAKADAVTFYGLLTDQFYFKSKRAIDQGMGERPFNEDSFDDDCIHKNFLGVCDKIDWKVGCHMDYWVRWADGGQTVGSVKGYQVSNYYHADATMHCKDQCQDEMDKWTAGFYLPALTTNSRPGTTILSPEYNNLKSLWKYLSTNSDPVGWTSCPGNTTP